MNSTYPKLNYSFPSIRSIPNTTLFYFFYFSVLPQKSDHLRENPGKYHQHLLLILSQLSDLQFSSITESCPTFCEPVDCRTPGFPVPIPNSWRLLKFMSIELVMSSNHLTLCRPLLLLPSIFSSIRVFHNESALHIRWPNTGVSASESVLPMNIQNLFPLRLTDLISLLSKGISRVFSNATVQNHQFFSTKLSFLSNSHNHT